MPAPVPDTPDPSSTPPPAISSGAEAAFWRDALLSDPEQGFCVLDGEGRIVLVSAALAEIVLGAPPSTMLALRLDEVFEHEIARERLSFLDRVVTGPRAIIVGEVWRGVRCRSVWRTLPRLGGRDEVLWTVRRAPVASDTDAPQGMDVIEAQHNDWGPLAALSHVQRRVLGLIGSGLQADQIAAALGVSTADAQMHRLSIERAMGTTNQVLLARRAFLAGLVT